MPAVKINLDSIEQGATWEHYLGWEDEIGALRDLTGWTARMQIREKADSADVLADLTTENGCITLYDSAGLNGEGVFNIALTLDFETTTVMTKGGEYDLELVTPDNSKVYKVCRGFVPFEKEVTR